MMRAILNLAPTKYDKPKIQKSRCANCNRRSTSVSKRKNPETLFVSFLCIDCYAEDLGQSRKYNSINPVDVSIQKIEKRLNKIET